MDLLKEYPGSAVDADGTIKLTYPWCIHEVQKLRMSDTRPKNMTSRSHLFIEIQKCDTFICETALTSCDAWRFPVRISC